MHADEQHTDPRDFWNRQYAEKDRMWSGRVNPTLATVVADLPVGRSLDLGSGEGGDVLWLAERGWQATGFELSEVAVARAQAQAQARGLQDRTQFVAQDIVQWEPAFDEQFDLITASFFQSPVFLSRTEHLRKAADQLALGGHLLLISHAGPPSWSEGREPSFYIQPTDDVQALALDGPEWELLQCEIVTRLVTGPEGQEGTIDDSLVLARRVAEFARA